MATRINKASRKFDEIRDALLKKNKDTAEKRIAPAIVKYERQLFELTVRGWNGIPDNAPTATNRGKKVPRPIFKPIVRTRRDKKSGVTITIRVYMADPSGRPSKVWDLLQYGRGEFQQRRDSPPLLKRKKLMTAKNRLRMDAFPGFTDEVYVVRAGSTVRAIPGREYYAIMEPLIRVFVERLFSEFEITEIFAKRAY